MAAEIIETQAPAKINVSLQVTGVRADGFHELRTIFQAIAVHDTVTVSDSNGPFSLECDDVECPADESNLVWRAAARVWEASGKRGPLRDMRIRLTKRIPLRAGLGGGSSDAAATIRAVGKRLDVDPARFLELAAGIGADVPYFLEGGRVLGLDRGDTLYPLAEEPPAWVVLAIPNFGVSTKDAYGWLDEERGDHLRRSVLDTPEHDGARASASGGGAPRGVRRSGGVRFSNDLESVVVAHHPEIGRLVRALERGGAAQAAMSGSGSAVFGLFARRADAQKAAEAVSGRGRRVITTRTLDRASYQRLARIRLHRIDLRIAPRRSGRS